MALVLADRVRDTTTTTGTGTVTLSGTAPTGYQNFSVVGDGNTTYYTINAASQWEVGIGTYSSTGPTLSRDTVLASSNGGALVDFAAGTKDVFVTYPAEKSVNYDVTGNIRFPGGSYINSNGDIYARRDNGTTGVYYFAGGVDRYLYWDGGQYLFGGSYTVAATRFYGVGDVRAPIFYDSDNTSYYLDLAGNSTVYNLNVYGNSGMYVSDNATTTSFVQVGTNYLYSENYPAGGGGYTFNILAGTGNSWVCGGSGSGNFGVGTTTPRGRVAVASSSSTGTSISSWSGAYSVFGPNAGSTTGAALGLGYNTSTDTAEIVSIAPNVAWKNMLLTAVTIDINTISGRVQTNQSFRAPIFYDSDNTGYYIDPASTSVLGQINFGDSTKFIRGGASGQIILGAGSASDAYIQVGGSYYPIWNSGNFTPGNYMPISGGTFTGPVGFPGGTNIASNGDVYARRSNGSTGVYYFADGGDKYLYWDGSGYYFGGSYNVNSYAFYATGWMQAPIFYDLNNTAYYVDPTGTSVLNYIKANRVLFSNGNTAITLDDSSYQILNDPTGRPALYLGGADQANYYDNNAHYFRNRVGSQYATIAPAGAYAAVFYDFNDTAYYADPASTSKLFNLTIEGSGNKYLTINSTSGNEAMVRYMGASGLSWYVGKRTTTQIVDAYGFHFFSENAGATVAGIDIYGNVGAANSFRAPIFYDSNNTSYYLDPSAGNLSMLIAGRIEGGFGAYSTSGTLDWNDVSNTRSGSTGTLLLGTATNGPGPSLYFHPFNFEYSSKDGTGNVTQMAIAYGSPGNKLYMRGRYSGSWGSWVQFLDTGSDAQYKSGYLESGSSLRAPIFYDSNNTAYYVDPASTSNFVGLTVANTITGSVSGGSGYANYVVGTNLGKTGSQGFFTTTSWTAADWANLAIGGGGMTIYGTPGQPTANYGFFMKIGNRDAGGPGWGGIWMDYYQGSLWYGNTTVSSSFATWYQTVAYGVNPGAGNIYAAVYYDANDTGYYVDPTGTSVLTTIYARKTVTNSTPAIEVRGGAGGPRIQTYGLDANGAAWMGLGTDMGGTSYEHSVYFPYGSSGEGRLSIGDYNGTTYNPRLWVYTSYTQINNSTRSPLFYDSDNTGYYMDPAGGSNINYATANDWYANGWFRNNYSGVGVYNQATGQHFYSDSGNGWNIAGGGGNNWLRFRDTHAGTVRGYVYADNGNNIGFLNQNGSWSLMCTGSANITSMGDFRAPIFYDSNNTAYYLDPNSTSNLYGLTVAATISGFVSGCTFSEDSVNRDDITTRTDSGFYQSSSGTTAEGWPINDGNWQHMISCTHTNDANYYAMQLGASFYNQGLFYRSTNGSGSTAWSRLAMYGSNYGSSLYASIYYDAENTSYYVDPAGYSKLYSLEAALNDNKLWLRGMGDSNHYLWNAGDDYEELVAYTGTGFRITSSSTGSTVFVAYGSGNGGYTLSPASSRAPIFYDSNNTAYYCDPNSTSQFVSAYTAGQWYFRSLAGSGVYSGAVTNPGLQAYSDDSGAAYMSFHRSGLYAVNFGLDPDNVMRIGGWSASSNRFQMDMSGNLTMAGNVTAYSDARLKKDVETIEGALDLVAKMRGVRFTRIENDERGVGVIAQEMLEVMPEVVQQGIGDDDTLSVAYGNLVGVLIEAVKELTARVAELEGK